VHHPYNLKIDVNYPYENVKARWVAKESETTTLSTRHSLLWPRKRSAQHAI